MVWDLEELPPMEATDRLWVEHKAETVWVIPWVDRTYRAAEVGTQRVSVVENQAQNGQREFEIPLRNQARVLCRKGRPVCLLMEAPLLEQPECLTFWGTQE